MKSNETQSSQEYETPQGVLLDLQNHYTAELRKTTVTKDRARYSTVMACIAVINPRAFKQFLFRKKKT